MASIGSFTATFLTPCTSHNRRLYTKELCTKAGQRLRERLADPAALPVTVLTHHAAEDDSTRIAGRVSAVDVATDGTITGRVDLADNESGRSMLALTTPDAEGRRFLDSMSIRAYWLGELRRVDKDGETLTTGDDLEIDGVDFTATPGVDAARLMADRQTREAAAGTSRTPITESIAPARVTAEHPNRAATIERLRALQAAATEAMVSISAWNGPADVDIAAYGISNDDLQATATKLGQATTAALRTLDPDEDGDVDLDNGATCPGCDAPTPTAASFCPTCGAPLESAEKENPVAETGPTKCPGCKSDVPAGAKKCPNCGADTATENTQKEAPVAENASSGLSESDRKAIADDVAAQLREAFAPAKPAEKAEETKPAETTAAESAPLSREDVASMIGGAMKEAVGGIATGLQEAMTQRDDALRASLVETQGPASFRAQALKRLEETGVNTADDLRKLRESDPAKADAYEKDAISTSFAQTFPGAFTGA